MKSPKTGPVSIGQLGVEAASDPGVSPPTSLKFGTSPGQNASLSSPSGDSLGEIPPILLENSDNGSMNKGKAYMYMYSTEATCNLFVIKLCRAKKIGEFLMIWLNKLDRVVGKFFSHFICHFLLILT